MQVYDYLGQYKVTSAVEGGPFDSFVHPFFIEIIWRNLKSSLKKVSQFHSEIKEKEKFSFKNFL